MTSIEVEKEEWAYKHNANIWLDLESNLQPLQLLIVRSSTTAATQADQLLQCVVLFWFLDKTKSDIFLICPYIYSTWQFLSNFLNTKMLNLFEIWSIFFYIQ